jgi:processive 1,2-diacylglycerol beta-glucosyltransferase
MSADRVLFLSGSLGKGHDTLAEACARALTAQGAANTVVDSMAMLGSGPAAAGDWVFRRLLSVTPIYDGFHFSQLRGDGPLGRFADRAAVKTMLPRLRAVVDDFKPDLLVSVFATGASAAAQLKAERPYLGTVVFMTDSFAHRIWVHQGTDLFLVTSELAAASVRRYWPQAVVEVVNAPVRSEFYEAPDQSTARAALGVPNDARCVLLMSGAWGVGPLDEVAGTLAEAGYWVLAVSGTNARLGQRLAAVAARQPTIIPFAYTDRVPELMAASDVVVTSSGDTCREARVLGRGLILLDVVPGHGRENLMHELELGNAAVCSPTPASVVGTVEIFLAAHDAARPALGDAHPATGHAQPALGDAQPALGDARRAKPTGSAIEWDAEFVGTLRRAGVNLPPP